jgi:hypothetical protein
LKIAPVGERSEKYLPLIPVLIVGEEQMLNQVHRMKIAHFRAIYPVIGV